MPAVRVSCRTAGEGLGRTARVFVSEESHRGIVPMKHSNQDGTLSAESAEGRLRLKENTIPPDTYPTQRGTARVQQVGECADRQCLAALYTREEPDALTSARPDLCGGHRATGVPTAITNLPHPATSSFGFRIWLPICMRYKDAVFALAVVGLIALSTDYSAFRLAPAAPGSR